LSDRNTSNYLIASNDWHGMQPSLQFQTALTCWDLVTLAYDHLISKAYCFFCTTHKSEVCSHPWPFSFPSSLYSGSV